MVPLVESFPNSSMFVPSTIGNAYGDIYEMQFETAKNSKMNQGIVPSIFETHMKPVMNLRRPQVPKPEPQPEVCNVKKWWHSCGAQQSRRRLQAQNDNYWKVQNSWGEWWGDDGFILIEITDGYGVCGINSVVEWVEMA